MRGNPAVLTNTHHHCDSALFVLYTPFLAILERSTPAAIESDPELTVALTALRFACKMSTEISCKINTDFDSPSRSPAVLCAPAGASCYRVILAYACISRIFPEEQEACQKAITEKFESLWLFSFRWGFAGTSDQIYKYLFVSYTA